LLAAGVDVLLDDRGLRPGVAFADMELIGIPHRLILGERGMDNGVIEYKHRASGEADEFALERVLEAIQQKLATA
jgi:prolyl-tRNA synthetase